MGFRLCEKCPNTDFFSGLYFPAFGLNTENTDQRNLCIWTLFTQCYPSRFFLGEGSKKFGKMQKIY